MRGGERENLIGIFIRFHSRYQKSIFSKTALTEPPPPHKWESKWTPSLTKGQFRYLQHADGRAAQVQSNSVNEWLDSPILVHSLGLFGTLFLVLRDFVKFSEHHDVDTSAADIICPGGEQERKWLCCPLARGQHGRCERELPAQPILPPS
jgi:hypothetical protein